MGEIAGMATPLTDLMSDLLLPSPEPTWPFPVNPIPTWGVPSVGPPTLVPEESGASVPEASVLEKMITGPPMAGFFAVIAALIAYGGISKTVKQHKDASNEVRRQHRVALESAENLHKIDNGLHHKQLVDTKTMHANDLAEARRRHDEEGHRAARKTESDRWWSTLTWAYEKAQESQNASLADDMDGFRKVAVVAILKSLSRNEQHLDQLQRDAVESIASIFGDSPEPDVRTSVEELYKTMGKPSPYAKRELYALHIGEALAKIPAIKNKYRDLMTPNGRHVHDWIVETTDGALVVIECAIDSRAQHLVRSLGRTVGKQWPNFGSIPAVVRERTVSMALLIHDEGEFGYSRRPGVNAVLPGLENAGQDFSESVGVVAWSSESGEEQLIQLLTDFFDSIPVGVATRVGSAQFSN